MCWAVMCLVHEIVVVVCCEELLFWGGGECDEIRLGKRVGGDVMSHVMWRVKNKIDKNNNKKSAWEDQDCV